MSYSSFQSPPPLLPNNVKCTTCPLEVNMWQCMTEPHHSPNFVVWFQVLQLRRPGPPCQRVQTATAAQEVPFLPKRCPHGCQLPNQSTAVLTRFAGKTILFERRGRRACPLSSAPQDPVDQEGGSRKPGKHRSQSNCSTEEMDTSSFSSV